MEFEFKPLVGALPITFDMTSADVEEILGPADSQRPVPRSDEVQDFWSPTKNRRLPLKVIYASDRKVAEIMFERPAVLKYKNVNLFDQAKLIELLSKEDNPKEGFESVLFLNLGIAVTGFHNRNRKNIVLFRKGRWDPFLDQLEDLKRRKRK